MREHSFRNDVVESNLSLPVMAVVTFLLWIACPKWDWYLWGTLVLVAGMTYVMVEWNNQCQLLRVRSRMNSVTFLVLMLTFPALHRAGFALVPAACLLVAYYMLFKAYGEYKPQGYAFHGFLFLGIGSLFFPPMLLLVPTLLFSASHHLRILTLKSFSSLMLGLILPFWLYIAAMCVAVPMLGYEETQARYVTQLHLPDFSQVALWQMGAVGFIALLGLVSIIHFVITSYNDKIRTRQYYYTMLLSFVPLIFVTAWWPEDFRITLPLLLVNLSPFVAHYLALAKSKSMRYIFWMWLLVAMAFGVANRFDLWALLEGML